MTFEDDFVRLQTESGPRNIRLEAIGLSWPPPEIIEFLGFRWKRERFSQITDEQRKELDFVMRGAEYVPAT